MNGPYGEKFPYTNYHDLNLDWVIKIAKDFLDQYTHIQDLIDQGIIDIGNKTDEGLTALQDKYEALEGLLDAWYNEHSEDIADQLADALADLNAWYTEHQDYLDSYLTSSISAFNRAADQKAAQTLESIPDDYTALGNAVTALVHEAETENIQFVASISDHYVKTDGTLGENVHIRVSDYIYVPDDAIGFEMYVLYGDTGISPAAACYDKDKTFIQAYGSANHTNGYKSFNLPANAKYVRFNQSENENDQQYCFFRFKHINYDNTDFCGYDSFSVTNISSSAKWSGIGHTPLKSGETYKIIPISNQVADRYRFFIYDTDNGANVNSNYVDLPAYDNSVDITANANGALRMYNTDNDDSQSLQVAIYRYRRTEISTTKKVYYVNKTAALKHKTYFTSVTACLLALKDDVSEKTIIIEGGDYDIVQEYTDANVPVYTGSDPVGNYFDYCVWVPKNTHIIGRGIVRLIWMPEAGTITLNQSKTVSPLNVAASCTIENIEVHCKNGRYCLHNDGQNRIQFVGAKQVYKNCKFVKYTNDDYDAETKYGFWQTIGFGISARMVYEFDGCQFINEMNSNAFYGHVRDVVAYSNNNTQAITEPGSGTIYLKNCLFDTPYLHAIRLDNVDSNALHVRVNILSCYINGDVRVNLTTGYQNSYDILIMNCNETSVSGLGSEDRYQPRIF